MSKNELDSKVKELRELKRMKDELETMIDAAQDEIKAYMTAQGVDALNGTDWRVTWTKYTLTRIDTTAFKNALPELAARFTKTTTSKRFSVT